MITSQCTKEAIWLRQLLAEVGYVQEGATSIMCDNQDCIQLAKNPMHLLPHQTHQHPTSFHLGEIRNGRDMFELLSYIAYNSRCTNKNISK